MERENNVGFEERGDADNNEEVPVRPPDDEAPENEWSAYATQVASGKEFVPKFVNDELYVINKSAKKAGKNEIIYFDDNTYSDTFKKEVKSNKELSQNTKDKYYAWLDNAQKLMTHFDCDFEFQYNNKRVLEGVRITTGASEILQETVDPDILTVIALMKQDGYDYLNKELADIYFGNDDFSQRDVGH